MNKINILILSCSLNIGGAEKHICDLVSNMDRNKYNFVMICLYQLGAIGETLLKEHRMKVYHDLMKNKFDILGARKLMRIVRNEKADILFIVHTPITLFWGIVCAKMYGIKATLTRCPTTNPTAHVKRHKIINFLILRFVDKIVAQANSHKEHQIKEGADPDKIVVISNGVDLERFTGSSIDVLTLKQGFGIPEGAPIVGIVARLSPEKGHMVLLRAARKIIDSLSQSQFLIVGDGRERNNLERMCGELLIGNNVHFLGILSDVSQVVQLFDVGILSTGPTGETFPNVVLEYMAASKPVVVTEAVRSSDIVSDSQTGYIVPCDDHGAMADAVIKLLKDKYLAKIMGEAGRKRVEEKFTIQRMINNYDTLFMSLSE
jgi:glycosyltransferase involved in cell wall biosynthesis